MVTSLEPPFHAEHIGSLLRPASLLARRAEGENREATRGAEDAAIRDAVALQLELGLSSITDGEFRRHAYSDSFTTDVFEGVKIASTLE